MKKKIFGLLLGSGLFLSVLSGGNFKVNEAKASYEFTGEGTKSSPYIIATLDELKTIASSINDEFHFDDTYFKLSNDIGSDEIPFDMVIGTSAEQYFNGYFDGDGHSIYFRKYNCQVSNSATFGYIKSEAYIENLTILGNLGLGTVNDCGLLCGSNDGGTIKNCITNGSVSNSGCTTLGGICGHNFNNGEIIDCVNKTQIDNLRENCGGICGLNEASISNSKNEAEISSSYSGKIMGGIAGKSTGKIVNCTNTGNIVDKMGYATEFGGIAGISSGTISDCSNKGNVTGGKETGGNVFGGICGKALKGSLTKNCTNEGIVSTSGNNKHDFGGIVGSAVGDTEIVTTISHCYNDGKVFINGDGYYSVGGICGSATTNILIDSCMNSKEVSCEIGDGQHELGGIVGQLTMGNIVNCSNKGDISLSESVANVGGIVGNIDNNSKIVGCTNYAPLTFLDDCHFIGGIAGKIDYTYIINSANYGSLDNTDSFSGEVGGIFGGIRVTGGPSSYIYNCINAGLIQGADIDGKGAIAGLSAQKIKYENCFYDNKVCSGFYSIGGNSADIEGARGLDTSCMKLSHGKKLDENNSLIDMLNSYNENSENSNKIGDYGISWAKEEGYPFPVQNAHKIIVINQDSNGQIFVESSYAKKGQQINIIVEPNEGYVLEKIRLGLEFINETSFTMPDEDIEIEAFFYFVHNHESELVNGKTPTEDEAGYKDCYKCKFCNQYFEDQELTKPIGDENDYEEWKTGDGYIPKLEKQIDNEPVENDEGLSGGAIAGIAVGSLVGAVLISYVSMFVVWKKNEKALKFLKPSFEWLNKVIFKK